mmetsp:Transcript_81475/g.143685  ORF Transcript_81475/g.143685 Transcript_81475/m.143685 type:complete len:358 (-) Transcript_81475:88-1161(-)
MIQSQIDADSHDESDGSGLYEELPELEEGLYEALPSPKEEQSDDEADKGPVVPQTTVVTVTQLMARREEELRRRNSELDRQREEVLRTAESNLKAATLATDSMSTSTASLTSTRGSTPATQKQSKPTAKQVSSAARGGTGTRPSSARPASATGSAASAPAGPSASEAAMQEQIAKLVAQLHDNDQVIKKLNANNQAMGLENGKLQRIFNGVSKKLALEKAANEELKEKNTALAHELQSLKKQLQDKRPTSASDTSKDHTALRLQRAQHEVEVIRTTAGEERAALAQKYDKALADAQKLQAEVVKLKGERSDLLLAFRKQTKLVDVLKRQKMHLEASRLLAFTEEEFTKTLELGLGNT